MDMSLTPDWTAVYSPEDAEKELVGFKWDGPGLYIQGKDSLLVIPRARDAYNMWHYAHSSVEEFLFCIYNGRDLREMINVLGHAPVRGLGKK